jgi:predicted O-methyltransferase YrrM
MSRLGSKDNFQRAITIPLSRPKKMCSDISSQGSPPNNNLPGISLNEQGQYALLSEYVRFYSDLPFSEKKTPERRYYYDNAWFGHSDAIFLYCFLRKYKPKRIIEVGSGFSSAVILDTFDSCFSQKSEITFIEPDPTRLISLFKEGDRELIRLIDTRVQEVDPDVLLALKSGDFLFIDSSHVVKCGSDLQFLIFEILPCLKSGVIVHFHDVFYPFDYPPEWLVAGRYWNENYFLRAFLSCNSGWRILFFNQYVHFKFGKLIKEKMPLCIKNTGGSLYIQRE